MSEMITTSGRSIQTVTAEIKVITKQAQQMLLNAAVEIGRRLVEAKSMVEHGEWGRYLETEVEFSQSSANNFMRIYQEYGTGQENLFAPNSQALDNLTYTKALKLLAIPAEERAEFAETNDVEHKSTRELDQLIRERDEALQAKGEIAALLEEFEGELEERDDTIAKKEVELKEVKNLLADAVGDKKEAESEAKKAKAVADEAKKQLEKLKGDLSRAEQSEKNALQLLEKAKKNPEVPASVMEQLRQEAEAKASRDLRKEMEGKVEAAEATAKEAQQKLEAIQKQAKMQSPDAAAFKFMFEDVQKSLKELQDALLKIKQSDPELAAKFKAAVLAVVDNFRNEVAK